METGWIVLIVLGAVVLIALAVVLFIKLRKNGEQQNINNNVSHDDDTVWLAGTGAKKKEELELELKKEKEKNKEKGYDFFTEMKDNMPNPIKDISTKVQDSGLKAGGRIAAGAGVGLLAALKRGRTRLVSPSQRMMASSQNMSSSGGGYMSSGNGSSLPSSPISFGNSLPNSSRISDNIDMRNEAYKSLRDQSLSPHAFIRGKGAWWEAFEALGVLGTTRETLQRLHSAIQTFATDEPPAWKESREKMERDMWAYEMIQEKYGLNRRNEQ